MTSGQPGMAEIHFTKSVGNFAHHNGQKLDHKIVRFPQCFVSFFTGEIYQLRLGNICFSGSICKYIKLLQDCVYSDHIYSLLHFQYISRFEVIPNGIRYGNCIDTDTCYVPISEVCFSLYIFLFIFFFLYRRQLLVPLRIHILQMEYTFFSPVWLFWIVLLIAYWWVCFLKKSQYFIIEAFVSASLS